MPRPQFTLRSLLVAMLVVAAFFGGMALQRQLDKPISKDVWALGEGGRIYVSESMTMRDGTVWYREEMADLNEGQD